VIGAAITVALLLAPAEAVDLPVEQTKKNVRVLTGMPSSQLIPSMAYIANSLGVTCAHCHAREWESDSKPPKDAARKMIAMQRAMNEQYYGGKLVITCNTCHQGHAIPPATPEIANAGWNAKPAATDPSVPAESALSKFVTPGASRRVIRGTVERYSGRDEPKSEPFTLTIEGPKTEYRTALSHPPEGGRALAVYFLTPPPVERLRGERWTFAPDLIRRTRETATPFGNLPEQIDYSDYRAVGGVRLPFRAQWSRADYRVTYTIEEIADEQ
jgi:hypothetical protein